MTEEELKKEVKTITDSYVGQHNNELMRARLQAELEAVIRKFLEVAIVTFPVVEFLRDERDPDPRHWDEALQHLQVNIDTTIPNERE